MRIIHLILINPEPVGSKPNKQADGRTIGCRRPEGAASHRARRDGRNEELFETGHRRSGGRCRAGRPDAGAGPGMARHPRGGAGNAPSRRAPERQIQPCRGALDGDVSQAGCRRQGARRRTAGGLSQ